MALFIILSKLTQKGAETLFENPDRVREVNKELERMGVKVLHQYLVFGDFDFLNIVEAESEERLARALINLNMRGTIRTTTYRVMELSRLLRMLKEAKLEREKKMPKKE